MQEMQDPAKLRKLARWYRNFAERASNPMIWECRLRTADDLEAEARRIEHLLALVDAEREIRVPRTR